MAAASREEAADGSSQASQVVKARLSWWDWYLLKLDSQPLQTKCATSALLALLSNALSRRIEGQRIFDDFPAYAKNSFVAIIWRSPTLHYWIQALNAAFKGWDPKSLRTACVKVLVHEAVYDPLHAATYMYLLGRLDGRGHADVLAQLRTNLVPAVKRNYQVWPLVQLVNFLYVPPRLSVAFIQTIAIVMNALLTWRARRL
eukprot:TRINITY_DN18706_c0_g1_i1.p1 TRINITY_DN18706_c0_g1~~TRINITY_DN18706_c0_g1_i1.p1  ORF type:complete len:201 (+),score=49.30 TRINITY_DN18706_c0_g1_i1:55-657(+)